MIFSPVLMDLYAKSQKDLLPKYILENESSFCSDLLDLLGSLPDHDHLL